MQQELKEGKVIVGIVIAERVGWKWREEHKNMERNVGFSTIVLAMVCVLTHEN